MKQLNLIQYVSLINFLWLQGDRGASLDEIMNNDGIKEVYGSSINQTTKNMDAFKRKFHRHKVEIATIFGIDIEYSHLSNKYYIEEDALLGNIGLAQRWLLDVFNIYSFLKADKDIQKRLGIQNPIGNGHIPTLLQAMQSNTILSMYINTQSSYKEWVEFIPVLIRQHKLHWYVIGKIIHTDGGEIVTCFNLLEILDISVTEKSYIKLINMNEFEVLFNERINNIHDDCMNSEVLWENKKY